MRNCLITTTLLLAFSFLTASAQSAKDLIKQTKEKIENMGDVEVMFNLFSNNEEIEQGASLIMSGKKYCVFSSISSLWFDGKTQWVLLKEQEEVHITEPTQEELMESNPFYILEHYDRKYKFGSLEKEKSSYTIHLINKKKKDRNESMDRYTISIDIKSLRPTEIIHYQDGEEDRIKILSIKKAKNTNFIFPKEEYKDIEIIDLR